MMGIYYEVEAKFRLSRKTGLHLNLQPEPSRKGATGFDGDAEVTVACRALGDS